FCCKVGDGLVSSITGTHFEYRNRLIGLLVLSLFFLMTLEAGVLLFSRVLDCPSLSSVCVLVCCISGGIVGLSSKINLILLRVSFGKIFLTPNFVSSTRLTMDYVLIVLSLSDEKINFRASSFIFKITFSSRTLSINSCCSTSIRALAVAKKGLPKINGILNLSSMSSTTKSTGNRNLLTL